MIALLSHIPRFEIALKLPRLSVLTFKLISKELHASNLFIQVDDFDDQIERIRLLRSLFRDQNHPIIIILQSQEIESIVNDFNMAWQQEQSLDFIYF